MPYTKLKVKEGFYTEDTRSDSAGRWIDGDHIRFVTDVPEKIGGWLKLTNQKFLGVCRGIDTWPTFDNDKYLAFGTNLKLYLLYQNIIYDITPYRTGASIDNPFSIMQGSNTLSISYPNHGLTTGDQIWFYNTYVVGGSTVFGVYNIVVINSGLFEILLATTATSTAVLVGGIVGATTTFKLTNPFSVTMGSNVVTVVSPNNGITPNDFVYFQNASTVGGLNLNGEWQVSAIIDANTYQFLASGPATSTVSGGGGTVYYLYEINTGVVDESAGYGYGVGTYGYGTFGTARPILGPVAAYPRIWTLDNWGDDLVAAPRDGGICYWTAQQINITNRAVPLPNSPAQVKAIAVWPESQILIAFGATDLTGVYNPMLIRVSDAGNPTVWVPDPVTNTSAFFLITNGQQIMQPVKMRGQILIATDQAIYSMYEDAASLFSFRMNATIQVMSPNAMVEANGLVIIFGEEQFFVYDGTLRPLKCDVRQAVFYNFNYAQTWKVYGSHNTAFNEVWWWYPSQNSMENNVYVVFNYQKNIWYYGTMDRTAFSDTAEVLPNPIATGSDGYLYIHEAGYDADQYPLVAYLESGDVSIAERNRFVYVKNVIPDLLVNNTPILFSMTVRRFPESPPTFVGEFTITPNVTDVIGTRAKGGQVSIRYDITKLGAEFKGGDVELLIIPTGTK